MINKEDQKRNIKRFEKLMSKVDREGKEELLNHIRSTDFFSCPSSTKYHLSCEGGLLQHSLNVYSCLICKRQNTLWETVLEDISEESLIIVALLHDLCKTNFYIKSYKNQKTYAPDKVSVAKERDLKHDDMGDFIWESVLKYEINDKCPIGHGEKSALLIMKYMPLKDCELFAIRWHMGLSEEKTAYSAIGKAMEEYPLTLALFEADMESSKLVESEDGNKKETEDVLPWGERHVENVVQPDEPCPFD